MTTKEVEAQAKRMQRLGLRDLIKLVRGRGAITDAIGTLLDLVDPEKLAPLFDAVADLVDEWPPLDEEGLEHLVDAAVAVIVAAADATYLELDDELAQLIAKVAAPGPLRDWVLGLVARWVLSGLSDSDSDSDSTNSYRLLSEGAPTCTSVAAQSIGAVGMFQLAMLLYSVLSTLWEKYQGD